eukprot:COSAG02_NODE_37578_length_440_cov_0.803519_1_plen_63_part_10
MAEPCVAARSRGYVCSGSHVQAAASGSSDRWAVVPQGLATSSIVHGLAEHEAASCMADMAETL